MLLLLHNLDNKSVSATLSDELLIIILGPFFSFPRPPLLIYLSTVGRPAELLLWLSLLVYSANQPSTPRGLRIQTSTASGYIQEFDWRPAAPPLSDYIYLHGRPSVLLMELLFSRRACPILSWPSPALLWACVLRVVSLSSCSGKHH